MTEFADAYAVVKDTFSLTRWLVCMAGVVVLVRALAMTFNRYGISYPPLQEVILIGGMAFLMPIFQKELKYAIAMTALIVGVNFYNRWRPWWDEQRRAMVGRGAPKPETMDGVDRPLITIASGPRLSAVTPFIHDRWFDADRVHRDDNGVVEIRLEPSSREVATPRGRARLLRIEHVSSIETDDGAGVGIYDVEALSHVTEPERLVLTGNIPTTIVFFVNAVSVTVFESARLAPKDGPLPAPRMG